MRFWSVALAVSAVKQEIVVPVCVVIPFGVEDIPRLPLAIASLANQDVKPVEVEIVANIPLSSNYNGFFMAPNAHTLEFKNMTGITNLPTDTETGSVYRTEQSALNHIFKVLDHLVVDAFVDIPNLQLWVRTREHSESSNRRFGASKCPDATEIVSFFTGSDLMHPNRIRTIWQEMSKNVHNDIPTVLLHNAKRFNPLAEDTTFERQEDMFGPFERASSIEPVAEPKLAVDVTSKIKDASSPCIDLVKHMHLPIASQWMSVTSNLMKERQMVDDENSDHFVCNMFEAEYIGGYDKRRSTNVMKNIKILHVPKALGLYLESPSNEWGVKNLKTAHLSQTTCPFTEELI